MLQSPQFSSVAENCQVPLSVESKCRKCLDAGILFLRNLVGTTNNLTFSACRDATFVTLASHVGNESAIYMLVVWGQGLIIPQLSPEVSPSASAAVIPTLIPFTPLKENHHPYHLMPIPVVGIAVTIAAELMLFVLIVLIWRKANSWKMLKYLPNPSDSYQKIFQEGTASIFKKYSYNETKKATNNFSTVIVQGGFGTVYKAELMMVQGQQ